MEIQIKRLTSTAKIPERGSDQAAGYDLFVDVSEAITIAPHETAMLPTGIVVAIPDGYWGGIFARSGLASKEGLRPANCVGVIDSDYRGEIKVALHNDSDEARVVAVGQKIAQLVICPYLAVTFNEVAELDETARGAGGFGSTGK